MDPACPFCDSRSVERVAQWGGQIITSPWRCLGCNSYFEAVRAEFDDTSAGREGTATRDSIPHCGKSGA
jgi:ribosomal protein L37AE/L43A